MRTPECYLAVSYYSTNTMVCRSLLQVPFLNLMGNLQSRVGRINIRVGGNTQETATLVPSTPDGRILEKDLAGITNPVRLIPSSNKNIFSDFANSTD